MKIQQYELIEAASSEALSKAVNNFISEAWPDEHWKLYGSPCVGVATDSEFTTLVFCQALVFDQEIDNEVGLK